MNVNQLIKILIKMDQDAEIFVPGCENGYNTVKNQPFERTVFKRKKRKLWDGESEFSVSADCAYDRLTFDLDNPIKAIIIS